MKKNLFILILIASLFLLTNTAGAQGGFFSNFSNIDEQVLLEPIPDFSKEGGGDLVGTRENKLDPTRYLRTIYFLALYAAVILSVLMIVIAGVKYTAAGINPSQRSEANNMITNAILGLLLAFASWFILNALNPSLTNSQLSIPKTGTSSVEPTGGGGLASETCLLEAAERYDGIYPTSNCSSGSFSCAFSNASPNMQKIMAGIKLAFTRGEYFADDGYPLIIGLPGESTLGSHFTSEIGIKGCNATRGNDGGGESVCGIAKCGHSIDSKHYGRESFKDTAPEYYGSNAIDYGMGISNPDYTKEWGDEVILIATDIAEKFNMKNFRAFCEPPGGGRVDCDTGQADHVHIEIWP